MLGSGDVDERTGKEPLLVNETVPIEFLPSDTSKPKSKRFTVVLAVVVGFAMAGAIGLGLAQEDRVWPSDIVPLVEFVEEQRGLDFVRPVAITETEPDPRPRFSDRDEPRPISFQCQFGFRMCPETEAFRLLGVNEFDPAAYLDLDDLVERQFNSDDLPQLPSAFYQRGTFPKIVLENTGSLPDGLRDAIIVHELVHALQDQHALLDDVDRSTHAGRIGLAVIEGDATRIASAYIEQLDPTSRAAAENATREIARAGAEAEAADPVRYYSDSTYSLGQAFSSLLHASEGQAGLDDTLREQTLDSDDVFVDILGETIQATVDASQLINLPESVEEPDGRVGAIGWFVTLAPLVGAEQAFDAIIGYDDDAWVIFDNPNVRRTSPLRTCIRSDIFFDTPAEAAQFADIVASLQAELTLDEQRRSVTLDVCDELRDADLQTAAVMIPIIAANHLAADHLENGETRDVARCAAIAQAKTIPIDLTFDEFGGYDTFIDLSGSFLEDCQ